MSTEHGSEGGEGETSTDEPSVKMCTWRPDEEETSSPTHGAPTAFPESVQRGGEEQTAMAAALPAAKVSAVSQGGLSGT